MHPGLPDRNDRSQAQLRQRPLRMHHVPGLLGNLPPLGPHFLSKCIRCSECMRTCPTGALQPLTDESTIEAMWTPVVVPRLGYCDYSCNQCGSICPVEAIPKLSLEEKRLQVIGKAYINQDRCIAWSDLTERIVC